jgi:uncharacterized integral membrane protein
VEPFVAKKADEVALEIKKIEERQKTIRTAIVGGTIALPLCVLFICSAVVLTTLLDTWSWIKLIAIILAPSTVIGGLVAWVVRKIRKRIRDLEAKLQSKQPVTPGLLGAGQPPPTAGAQQPPLPQGPQS